MVRPGELVYADYDGIVVIPGAVEQKVWNWHSKRWGRKMRRART